MGPPQASMLAPSLRRGAALVDGALLVCLSSAIQESQGQTTAARRLKGSKPSGAEVCILGAGASGLGAALRLREKGYSLHLFERESLPGGQALNFKAPDGTSINMGPVVGVRGTAHTGYAEMFKLIAVTNPATPIKTFAYDYETGMYNNIVQKRPNVYI